MPPAAERDGSASRTRSTRTHWVRRSALILGAAAVLYLVAAVISVLLASRTDQRSHTDAIVVLGAAQYDGTPSPVLKARLDHALYLYRHGVAPKIVLTGSKQSTDRFTEAYAGFTYLLKKGVGEDAMDVVTDGDSTYESLAATARLLRREDIRRVTLVSDGYHNRRMQGIASEVDLDARVSPSSHGTSISQLARESALVAIGEIVGFRRLDRLS